MVWDLIRGCRFEHGDMKNGVNTTDGFRKLDFERS